MTTAPAPQGPVVLDERLAGLLMSRLETGFAAEAGVAVPHLAHQYLLDALDRGQLRRFLVWPADDPVAAVYTGATGTVVPAGVASGGGELAACVDRVSWRVLIGDAGIALPLLAALPRSLLRRRPTAREQRFMVADPGAVPSLPAPPGLRRAAHRDVERMTDLACHLHVEDRMGPPISRSARAAVRARVVETVGRGASWVVEADGGVVAKFDLSLYSRRRGAQIAGVYVDRAWRGRDVATRSIAAITAALLEEGLPGVTLHVRSDNTPAMRAYEHAGFRDHGPWTLALR